MLTAKILESTHGVSKLLQNQHCDLSKAASLIQASYESLQKLRNGYDEMHETAAGIAKVWGTSQQFQDRRVPKVRKFWGRERF